MNSYEKYIANYWRSPNEWTSKQRKQKRRSDLNSSKPLPPSEDEKTPPRPVSGPPRPIRKEGCCQESRIFPCDRCPYTTGAGSFNENS